MASYPKFTLGPWGLNSPVMVAADGRAVAFTDVFREAEECRENARLIVEAPTMVELLCEAIDWLEGEVASILDSHCETDDDFQPIRSTLDEAAKPDVEAMEAVISKSKELFARVGINPETISFRRSAAASSPPSGQTPADTADTSKGP